MNADVHASTAAAALDALSEEEADEFSAHLETCESCTTEYRQFLETAARLGMIAEETPPASLRASVMQAIAVTPQLPVQGGRHLSSTADSQAGATTDRRADRSAGPHANRGADDQADRQAEADTQADPQDDRGTPTAADERRSAPDGGDVARGVGPDGSGDVSGVVVPLRRRWYARPGTLIAAAVAGVAVIAGTIFAITRPEEPANPILALEQCVLNSDDQQQRPLVAGDTGAAIVSPSCAAVVVPMDQLPLLGENEVYQLWLLKGDQARSAGLLQDTNPDGTLRPAVTTFAPDDTNVAISREPAGGSPSPTVEQIVVVAPLA